MTSSVSHTDIDISLRLSSALDQLAEGVIIADEAGEIIYINASAAKLHGIRRLGVRPSEYSEAYSLTTMDGEPYPSDDLPLSRAVKTGIAVEDAYWRINREDGTVIVAFGTARPVINSEGVQIGSVLTLRDETEREGERKALKAALDLKDMLLREIHHRVKNNLQLVSSLLNLQGRKTKDIVAKEALKEVSSRIDIIANIHRALYAAGETGSIEVVGYLEKLCDSHFAPLAESFNADFIVRTKGSAILPIEKATSVALALNELVLNSLKHAFPTAGTACINLAISTDEQFFRISYTDNGPGPGAETVESKSSAGFGRLLFLGLERQLGATIERSQKDDGYCVEIKVPLEGNLVVAA